MREKLSVGLEIGNRHINMVKLAWQGGEVRLVDFASAELAPNQNREERLRHLKSLVQEKNLVELPVNIGASGESVIVRYIDLPKMKNDEINQALKYEAQKYIPFKMEEVIFDFHILRQLRAEEERIRVLLAAAKKQAIMEFVEFIHKAGLKPNLIDVNSFSLINCFQKNGPEVGDDLIFSLVNLEFDLLNINILQGKIPLFSRDVSLEEDVFSLWQEKGKSTGLFEMVKPLLANIVREIRLSIDYFESEFEKQVEKIYLSGEGARISELISYFNHQLGKEVGFWNPVQNLQVDSSQTDAQALSEVSSMLALACGLALRGVK